MTGPSSGPPRPGEFVEVGTATIEVARLEPPERRGDATLVFLHEGLGCVELWRDFPARVVAATGLPAVVYSRAGYGRSSSISRPRPVDYLHREAVEVLPALLDTLAVTEPILIGHSDGASIALILAGARPSAVRALVVMAPHVFVESISIAGAHAARTAATDGPLLNKLARYHDDVDTAFWGWNDIWLAPDFAAWDIRAGLGAITAPILAIQGDGDEYGTVAQVNAIASATRGCRVAVLRGCGHSPPRDQPEIVLSLITSFFEAHGF